MEGEGSDSEAKIIDDNDDSHKWNEFNPPTHDQTWTDGDPEGAKAAVPVKRKRTLERQQKRAEKKSKKAPVLCLVHVAFCA